MQRGTKIRVPDGFPTLKEQSRHDGFDKKRWDYLG